MFTGPDYSRPFDERQRLAMTSSAVANRRALSQLRPLDPLHLYGNDDAGSGHRPRFSASAAAHRQLLTSFFNATRSGDLDTLTRLLTEEVALWADSNGRAKAAAMHPINGREAVTAFLLEFSQVFRTALPQDATGELVTVNGLPALVLRGPDRTFAVLTIEVEADRIQVIRFMVNPQKLGHV